jgi:hypothetical protein
VFFNYKVEGKIGSKKYEKLPSILVKNVLSHTITLSYYTLNFLSLILYLAHAILYIKVSIANIIPCSFIHKEFNFTPIVEVMFFLSLFGQGHHMK